MSAVLYLKEANITGLQFEPWTAEQIRKFSVVEITNPKLYDNQTPSDGGLRDERMGITSRKGQCKTCNQIWKYCPGHFGHLELATPLYHPGWVHLLIKTLKSVCLKCWEPMEKHYSNRKDKKCEHCGEIQATIQKHDQWFVQINGKPLLPCDAVEYLKNIKKHEAQHSILTVLPIPPNCVRPSPTIGGDEIRGEDDLTRTLLRIVRMNNTVSKHLGTGVKHPSQIKNVLKKLQEVVSGYIYRSRNTKSKTKINAKITCMGDRIRHKHGRIRGNAMGKRVNFTARGVVGPDSKMGMHQVGIPQFVADTLTVTETIHAFNMKKWQDIISNYKSDKQCPVKFVVRADNKRLDLRFNKPQLQIGWKVERKLQNGDIALFNRQPSLHKMSIMAHEVLILPGKTFRLNLSCTTPYNADFDGDEMNFHALQTIEARAEAENIMAVKHNIITPQSHRPVMSLVMDGFLGTSELSHGDSFLEKRELFDWMMETNTHKIPIPAICHPKPIWTGKQALSMIMPEDLQYKQPKAMINEQLNEVCIKDGNILYGQFGKKILGRSQGSLIHIIWLDFGPDVCINFLNKLQLGVHRWFSEQGFSIGVGDFIASKETQIKIEKEYQEAIKEASTLTKESDINQCLNRARNGMGRAASDTMGRDNFLYRMVSSGVKGSMMNILQIMAMVGQQNSGGKRIQTSIAGKTLPCFKAGDNSPAARGMVRNPYMAGLTPYEFFFTGIVGRDGLINTAINTAVTGYIQRRLIKAMETCRTEWDGSVRDANGAIITFQYGEDGFDGQSLEFNGIELAEMSDVRMTKIYDWGMSEELEWVAEAKNIIKNTGLRNISSCFNVRRQINRLVGNNETTQCMPDEVFECTKSYFKWFKDRNILVWALLIQSCAAKRLSIEFKLSIENIKNLMELFKNKYERTLVPAGEMVGTLAAQSLGEPVTQMTLDTFHHAGNSAKDVTLGVPRFEELINASNSPKTPTCSIVFNNAGPAEIDKAVEISYNIVHLIIRDVVTDPSIEHIKFSVEHPTYYLIPDVPFKRLDEKGNWCVKLTVTHERLVKLQIEFQEIVKALRLKFSKGVNIAYTFNPMGDSTIHLGNYGKKNNKTYCAVLRNRIMNCYIRGVPDIKYAEPCLEDGILTVETKGTNIYELYKLKLDYPCVKTVRSNHPFDVLDKFGIEAARATLYQQCHMVLSRDGSYVSVRHYQVMVDRMTFSGAITATTRHGIAKYENKSPLARATFEQPVEVLLNAASGYKEDPLSGVSEQILMGITPNIGTATISVHRTEEYKTMVKEAAEEESDEEDEGWFSFDNSTPSNPFQNNNVTAPLAQGPMSWNQPQIPVNKPVPMWAQQQHSMPSMQPVQTWSNDVMAAVGDFKPKQPNMFAPPQNMFAPPQNMFAPPQNMFAPPQNMFAPPQNMFRPTSPEYDPNRPTSPEYDPNRPVSPQWSPTDPPPVEGPTTPDYSPTSPMYSPPNSPKIDEDDDGLYDPNKGYGAEN